PPPILRLALPHENRHNGRIRRKPHHHARRHIHRTARATQTPPPRRIEAGRDTTPPQPIPSNRLSDQAIPIVDGPSCARDTSAMASDRSTNEIARVSLQIAVCSLIIVVLSAAAGLMAPLLIAAFGGLLAIAVGVVGLFWSFFVKCRGLGSSV